MQMKYKILLIAAVIGAAGMIIEPLIVAWFSRSKAWDCKVEVKDIMGNPIQASLWLTKGGEKEVALGVTDEKGIREIEDLRPGKNTVRMTAEGYVEISEPIKNWKKSLPINLESTDPQRPQPFSQGIGVYFSIGKEGMIY